MEPSSPLAPTTPVAPFSPFSPGIPLSPTNPSNPGSPCLVLVAPFAPQSPRSPGCPLENPRMSLLSSKKVRISTTSGSFLSSCGESAYRTGTWVEHSQKLMKFKVSIRLMRQQKSDFLRKRTLTICGCGDGIHGLVPF